MRPAEHRHGVLPQGSAARGFKTRAGYSAIREPICATLRVLVSVVAIAGASFAHAAEAKRIVSLAPFLTELVYAAGAGGSLVGVSAFSDHPGEARALPVVADAGGVNREAVLALRADTVLAWTGGTPARGIDLLRDSGVRVVWIGGDRIDDIARMLRVIGVLAGTAAVAESAAARFESELEQLRSRYARRVPLGVMLEVWHRPLLTVSGNHFISDALASCGARNLFAREPGPTAEISIESVFNADPDAIVGTGTPRDENVFRDNWAHFPALAAVKHGRLIYIDADLIQRQTPRIILGMQKMCAELDRIRSSRATAK